MLRGLCSWKGCGAASTSDVVIRIRLSKWKPLEYRTIDVCEDHRTAVQERTRPWTLSTVTKG